MTKTDQKMIFSRNLNYQISTTGKSQKDICQDLDVSTSTMNNWCKGNSIPKMDMIQKLADYFGIGKSDLIDDKIARDSAAAQGREDALFLIQYHKLNPQNKAILKSTMMAMLAAQDSSI